MAAARQPFRHIGAHAPQADHCQFHGSSSFDKNAQLASSRHFPPKNYKTKGPERGITFAGR
jgi:hypothetical protein